MRIWSVAAVASQLSGSLSGAAGGLGTGGTAGTAEREAGGSPSICAEGDVLTSACIDGSLVPRCVCLGGDWDCMAEPEQACPGYCSDGSELDTTLPVPDCEGAALGIQNAACRIEHAAETRRLSLSAFPLGRVSLDSALFEACLLGLAQVGCDDAMPNECDAALAGSVTDNGSCGPDGCLPRLTRCGS